jgi:hypothetical protein
MAARLIAVCNIDASAAEEKHVTPNRERGK